MKCQSFTTTIRNISFPSFILYSLSKALPLDVGDPCSFLPSFPIYFLSVVSHLFLPCSVAVSHSLYLRTSRDRVLPLFRSSLPINTLPNATITVYYCGFVFRNLLFLITVRTVVILGDFSFFSCFSNPRLKTLIVRYNRFPPFPKFIISQST